MSGGLSFGMLPTFADLDPAAQAAVMQRLQAQFGGEQPAAPQTPGSLLGQVDPQNTGAIPTQSGPPVAMNEAQTQRLERQQAGPQDRAALGSVPGSPDQLLYDRGGLGGGLNPFSGSADPMGSRMVPSPPPRPSDADLLTAPTATGSVSGMPQSQTVASSKAVPGPLPNQHLPATPADRTLEPMGGPPIAGAFDPLTGQITSGQPRPLGAPQGAVSPAGAAAATGASSGLGQGSVMEKFIGGINHPDFSNLMLNLGIGLMSNRGIGPGVAAGLQGYQQSRIGDVKQQLEQFKLMQAVQGQQAQLNYLTKTKGYSPEAAAAMVANPTLLTNQFSQEARAPNTVDMGGVRYLVPPNSANDPSQWQRIGAVNGPQPGFEADPNNPGGQRPVVGGQADPNYKATVAGAEAKAKDEAVEDKPLRGRPGDVFVDPKTLKPAFSVPSNEPEGFKTEDKLRTEFSKQLGTFSQVHDGYGRVIAATKQRETNPGAVSPASDMGLVFGFMKMLDPNSVVREGEYATAKNATGVPEQVLNAYNKARNGEFLSDTQRKDFLGQAAELYGTARHTADGVAERYRGLATQYGVDPGRSVYLPEAPVAPKLGVPTPQAGGAAARYQALIQGGMSKADAFAQMHKEGL